MNYLHILLLYLLIINIIAFIAYYRDKCKARAKAWRTPEATLLILAALGGSIGAWAAMRIFHHKTNHPQFYIGVPLIFFLQIAIALYLYLH